MNHVPFGLSLILVCLVLGALSWRPMRRLARQSSPCGHMQKTAKHMQDN